MRGVLVWSALALSLAGCNCGPGLSSAEADVQVVPLALDFGPRAAGTSTTLTLELTNTGVAPLVISRAQLEADTRHAFTVGEVPTTLAPGASASLAITYLAPMLEGPDGASLRLESNARSTPEVRVSLAARSVRSQPDAGLPDAGEDAGVDAGAPDAGEPDAGEADAGEVDAGPEPGGCVTPLRTGSRAVTYQVDLAHTGSQPGDELRLPLCRRWRQDLGGAAGYPVVADGRVFVVSRNNGGTGTLLWALEQRTGAVRWGPVDLGGTYWWSALAWDAGRVFAVNSGGFLRAFDAATGAMLWGRQLPGQYSCDSAPTASSGMVYTGAAGSGGTVYGLWAGDGGVRWSMPVANGNTSSPAVSATGVFVSYACNQAYGFAPTTGAQQWHHSGPCSGGGGKTVVLYRGRVYTRDSGGNLVLDAATGAELSTFSSRFIPAMAGELAFTSGPALRALVLDGGSIAWTLDAGAEPVVTAPLAVGPHVVTATGTRLLVVNASDGTIASSFAVSGVLGPDEQNVSSPLAGLAAADGMLFVPVGTGLEAY